jgi:hypothetical protein
MAPAVDRKANVVLLEVGTAALPSTYEFKKRSSKANGVPQAVATSALPSTQEIEFSRK